MTDSTSLSFPLPTFQSMNGHEASSADLLQFLQALVTEHLTAETTNRIPTSGKDTWISLILGLTEHFLLPFPSPSFGSWHTLHEKIRLSEVTLDITCRAAQRVDTLFSSDDEHIAIILIRLLKFMVNLEQWSEMRDSHGDDSSVASSRELYSLAVNSTISVLESSLGLHSLSSNIRLSASKALQCFTGGLLQSMRDVKRTATILPQPFDLPGGLTKLGNHGYGKGETHPSHGLLLENQSQLAALYLTWLRILVKLTDIWQNSLYVCSPDKIRRILLAMMEFIMSGTNNMSTRRRMKYLVSCLELCLALGTPKGPSTTDSTVLAAILLWRMKETDRTDYDELDIVLQKFYNDSWSDMDPGTTRKLLMCLIQQRHLTGFGHSLKLCGDVLSDRILQEEIDAGDMFFKITKSKDIIALKTSPRCTLSSKMSCDVGEPDKSINMAQRLEKRRQLRELLFSLDDMDWGLSTAEMGESSWLLSSVKLVISKLPSLRLPSTASASNFLINLVRLMGELECEADNFCDREQIPELKHALHTLQGLATMLLVTTSNYDAMSSINRKHTFEALRNYLRNAPQAIPGRLRLSITESVKSGLKDKDRETRLSAGRTAADILNYLKGDLDCLEDVFRLLYTIMKKSRETQKETAIITVGLIGRTSNIQCLGRVVCFLFAFLDENSILLRGAAYMQLLNLVKYHKKSSYMMIAPYMRQVSVFLITNINRRPNLLTEACRFLFLSPGDFIAVTLPHTLPVLFGACDKGALDKVGQEIHKKVSTLFLNASSEILGHVFMLEDQVQADNALQFIVSVLSEAANKAKIDEFNVIGSCIVPLLATLIIATGSFEKPRSDIAFTAVKKVQIIMGYSNTSSGEFLSHYVLGVITHMNDVLHDVQGRKTLDMKEQVLRGLCNLIMQVGPMIITVAPQIMATLQTAVQHPSLAQAALQSWLVFMHSLTSEDLGPYVGQTSATVISVWPHLSAAACAIAKQIMEFIILEKATVLGRYLDEIAALESITELTICARHVENIRQNISLSEKMRNILYRTYSDNVVVVIRSLEELKVLMQDLQDRFFREFASGDAFDPLVGQLTMALLNVACRDGDNVDAMRLLAFECIGLIGALDPDRFELLNPDSQMVVTSNFGDENESINFAIHLIETVLVRAFRSTSDIKYQNQLAYAIQELLKFCRFTSNLVMVSPSNSVLLKVRTRWNALPKHVLETVTPLLESRFTLNSNGHSPDVGHPIYLFQSTYREWIQMWVSHLISRASGQRARTIFEVFRATVRNKDVGVAHYLLPHLALNVMISGNDSDKDNIRCEIIAVLEDQINVQSSSSTDKRLLCAQTIFLLMDHVNKWIRVARQENNARRLESKRARHGVLTGDVEEQLLRVDSILSSIDQDLIAKAAFQCKAYARSLMNFEKQILKIRSHSSTNTGLQAYYDKLHEIYSHLDEPDGMEGISTCIVMPSLEHQIRQHESTGRWTSAQSCWEVCLQDSPSNIEYHKGLMRCLRNLGHYDTLRTHIRGVLTKHPSWEDALAGFSIEIAWLSNDWATVQKIAETSYAPASEIAFAKILLAMRTFDNAHIHAALSAALQQLGVPIAAAGEKGYRRAYDAILNLHMVQDLKVIFSSVSNIAPSESGMNEAMSSLSKLLSSRLDSTLPTFRTREPILNMHRTAFSVSRPKTARANHVIGLAWLSSAKIARKAGHWQTAYTAVLQAQKFVPSLSFLQGSKLVKVAGEPLRALHELNNALGALENGRLDGAENDVVDLTEDDSFDESLHDVETRAKLLRVRWMQESERFDAVIVHKELSDLCKAMSEHESAHFHAGHFQDECYRSLHGSDKKNRGPRMNLYTVKAYSAAIRTGTKYTYQTIPRLLTLWLDMGEDPSLSQTETFKSINLEVELAIESTPVYKWLTAFPQIVSRVEHKNTEAYNVLSKLIVTVLKSYPQQALWLFMSVVNSTRPKREKRGRNIIDQLKTHTMIGGSKDGNILIAQCLVMSTELLRLCDHPIKDDHARTMSMNRDFPALAKLAPSSLIIPLQETLTVTLPPSSSLGVNHQPFPQDAPTIDYFYDEVTIMKSLAKPRKITIRGSDGQIYMFLGKPKDDLRKDARLMDFNSIINKLLKKNSDSRRRQLHIRTYSVVTLNEECGFIQWVPNTIPIRPILLKYYTGRGIESWSKDLTAIFNKIKEAPDKEASKIFQDKVLAIFPPLFHEWFIETFPEPSAWLSSRLAYGRTAAVMSMVGFILGLGDRHLENILLDTNTGDIIHVDFNCLFEKGKTLETPERVPFRLTNNLIDALGVTGVEGVFRVASEITMQLLRDNKDALMSVLDAFIHDPLVEWEDEKRRMERQTRSDRNAVKESVDLRKLAKNALYPIEKKLRGLYSKENSRNEKRDKEVSISNLVQMLIEEATDLRNLAKMYPGWVPYH